MSSTMFKAAVLTCFWLGLGACRVDDQGFGGAGPSPVETDAGFAGEPEVDAPVMVASPDAPLSASPDAPVVANPIDAPASGNGLPLGGSCSLDQHCGSGVCAMGVCCESRCNAPCMGCNLQGRCMGLPRDTACGVPDSCGGSTLTPAPTCDGAGVCVPRDGQACPGGLKCAADGAHCLDSCTRDADCAGTGTCNNGQCVRPGKALGVDCNGDGATDECQSGFCIDGVCCETACTGACMACLGSVTGATDGKCANVEAGRHDPGCTREDPSTCGEDGTCDGQGHCQRYPDGTACGGRCCTTNRGQGSGSAPCELQCKGGSCDRNNPVMTNDRCGVGQCCCPPSGSETTASCRSQFQCGSCQ